MNGIVSSSQFESAVLEHSDAAYNLARWMLRNDQDAHDAVQDACMQALRSLHSFRGGDFRAWFLTIVRNSALTCLRRSKRAARGGDAALEMAGALPADGQVYDPHAIAERATDAARVRGAIEQLPDAIRETVVLREMEGMSYKEIGRVTGVPIGTVMSRLARGRMKLQALLMESDADEDAT